MIEEGVDFSATIPYPKNTNRESRRNLRRKIILQVGELGAEQIQISPSELEEVQAEQLSSRFRIRGFVPSRSGSLSDVEVKLRKAGAKSVRKRRCSTIRVGR